MKKAIHIFVLAALAAMPFATRAQGVMDTTVAEGYATNYRVPMYGYGVMSDQHVQIIYDESIVGQLSGNEITGLTFYVSSGFSDVGDAVITLGTTTASNMNNDQWVGMTDTAVVYSGEMAQAYSQMTVTFTQPYTYNGGNLVVDINYSWTCCNTASVAWLGINTTDKVSAFDDYYEGAPRYTYNFLPMTTFSYSASSCLPASDFAVASLDTAAVSLSWTSSPTAVSYNVTIGDSTYTTTGTSITIDGLSAGTTYTASLQASCDNGATSQARSVSFRTPLAPAAVPYTTGFEPDDDNAMWQLLNGASAWVVNNAISHSGSQALYTSGDNGVSVGCQPGEAESYSFAVRSIYIESAGQYRLDYRWRPNSTVVYDYGRAYIAPAGALIEANMQPGGSSPQSYTPDGWVNAGRLPLCNFEALDWVSDSCIFNINSSDTIVNLVFLWYNGPYSLSNNGMAIDDISLVKLPCANITGLTLTETTGSSATFTWGNTHYTYQLEARLGDSVCASTTLHGETTGTLTGLQIDNDYQVYLRGACDEAAGEYTAWYGPVRTHIGYCEPAPMNVDGQGIVEVSYGTGLVATNNQHPTTAPYYANYHDVVGIASPGDVMPVDITYRTRFAFGSVYDYGTIIWIDWNRDLAFSANEVVYIGESDTTEPSVLHAQVTIPTSAPAGDYRMRIAGASTGFDEYITSFSAAAGANPCFDFSFAVAHDYTIRVAASTECPNVDSVWVDSVSDRTASLGWTSVPEATYTILLGTDTVATGISDTAYTIDNLAPSTRYNFVLTTNCVDSSSSFGVYATVYTDCGIIDELPFAENFSNEDALRCWTTLDLDGVPTTDWYRHQIGEVRSNYTNAGNANDWLVMPPVVLPADLGAATLSFDAHGNNDANTISGEVHFTHMTVLLSTTGLDPASFTHTLFNQQLPDDWTHFSVGLDEFLGDTVYVAFIHDSYFDMGPVVDNVDIRAGSVCAAPTVVSVTDLTTNSASISFNGIAGNEHIVYITDGISTIDSMGITETSYTFMNLQPATRYTIRVGIVCDQEIIEAMPITVVTIMPDAELPYSTTFDSVAAGEWITSRGTYGWFIGTDTAAVGTHSLYVSADSGATRSYTVGAAPSKYAYKTFSVPAGQYAVSYEWLGQGAGNAAFLRAFLAPVGASLADGISNGISCNRTPDGWIALDGGSFLNGTDEWQSEYHTFGIDTDGIYSLVFYWNGGLVGEATTAAAVDNVSFHALTCQAPTGLVFSDITSDAVSLSWMSDADTWLVSVDGGAWQLTTTNTYSTSGLSAGTLHTFTVRAYCGVGDTSYALVGSFRTNCDDTPIPWIENFDTMPSSATASPMTCWNILGQGFVNAVPFTGNGQVLQFTPSMTSAPIIAVLPPFDTALTELQLSYRHGPEQVFSGTFSVGYITNVADSTTFTAIVSYSGADLYGDEITFFADTLGFADAPADARIAFRYDYPGRPGLVDWFWLLDDVVVSLPDTTVYYAVTLVSEDPMRGSVTPAGTTLVAAGETFTATATPAQDFIFSHWSSDAATDVNSDPVYSFVVTQNVSLTAHFIPLDGINGVDADGVSIYPSPATDHIVVDAEGVSRVQVLDAAGRVAIDGSAAGRYDIRTLAAGCYLVRVVCADGVALRRIVKM